MAGIRMNSIHALTLAAIAQAERPICEARALAKKADKFFDSCDKHLKENCYWTDNDLIALINLVAEKEE